MEVANQVLGVIAPFAGGLLGYVLGPIWLIAVSIAIVLAAVVPLLAIHASGAIGEKTADAAVTYRLTHAPRRDVVANFCFNIETLTGTLVWPIYLAVVIKTYEEIGAISALAAIASVIVVIIAGRRGDAGKDRRVLLEGVATSSALDFIRLLPLNSLGVTFVSAGYRASVTYMFNAWVSTYYYHTKRIGIPYVMSMEIACDIAYVLFWTMLFAVSLFASSYVVFSVAFVVAGVAAWGCMLISHQGELETATP